MLKYSVKFMKARIEDRVNVNQPVSYQRAQARPTYLQYVIFVRLLRTEMNALPLAWSGSL